MKKHNASSRTVVVDPGFVRSDALRRRDAPLTDKVDALLAFVVVIGEEAQRATAAVERAGAICEAVRAEHAEDLALLAFAAKQSPDAVDANAVRAAHRRAHAPLSVAQRQLASAVARRDRVEGIVDRLIDARRAAAPASPHGLLADIIENAVRTSAEMVRAGAETIDEAEAHITLLVRQLPNGVECIERDEYARTLRAALTAREPRRGAPKKSERGTLTSAEAMTAFLRALGLAVSLDARRKAAARRRRRS